MAGNKVFLNDGTTLLNDGYYGIAATGSTASAMIRVIAGFVASGYPLQCEELDQIYQKIDQLEKREIEIKKLMNYKDHYFYFLLIGIILFS